MLSLKEREEETGIKLNLWLEELRLAGDPGALMNSDVS